MITISIPKNNLDERKYIIDVLFQEFLGLGYEIVVEPIENYEINLGNGNRIVVEDHFFNKYPEPLAYLQKENLPDNISFIANRFVLEAELPVIFGTDKCTITDSEVICGVDIFASSFFMLTRWEEYVDNTRDIHGRFPAKESTAYRNGFLHRPIVNEYVEMLWKMLSHLGVGQEREPRSSCVVLTHDVDRIFKYYTVKNGIREFADDLLKKKSIKSFAKHFTCKIKSHLGTMKDSYDTYDFLMDISEKSNTKSYFFFMAGGSSAYDPKYNLKNKRVKKVIENIKSRGHNIGVHPSYDTFDDKVMFLREKNDLEDISGKIEYGRQHFLRFDNPVTWQIWEDAGMKWDSTLGYPDKNGFRCGVCYEYSVFDILERKKLNLKEKPLIIMDTVYVSYDKKSDKEIEDELMLLLNQTNKYNGELVILLHNSNIEHSSVWDVFTRFLTEVV